ncbi:ATPase, V1 complex, subunit C [Rozella allomycis CSF55]|uniref:V-type proton ATPase subunit C n=1 Tax=Rozella allomycis (strain CSF55) TaxID=988480 RepID=A0A075ATE6_ROZAC|nr:ATPase, V1 complex, subunit C domain-containing protein [Rozella allomycis CSF55]RKP18895.1 ATPase, V1 complex, subunit C [Rozella allomycis CSF55]|eukprot:EPZ31995.1 ATPase, V1 complex, subunit C domain-containing protein [Rozella allomycis CSF55]
MSTAPAYWLVSVPPYTTNNAGSSDNKKQQIFTTIKTLVQDQAELYKFPIPDFKVGTLDQLVTVTDELAKMDVQFESMTIKIIQNLKSILPPTESALANVSVNEKTPDQYIRSFQWNTMKYRQDKPIKDICEVMVQEMTQLDNLIRSKMTSYNQVKASFGTFERKQTGNLLVKNLSDIVKKEHFVLESEYMDTLVVAVPKFLQKEWLENYETLTAMVVPRSTQLIIEDEEHALYTVTLFKRVAEEFTTKAREKKFIVREFRYNAEDIQKEKNQIAEMGASMKEQWSNLLRLLKTNFGEAFAAWIHVKALRIFVESVLRFGLPPVFQPVVLKPKNKAEKKLREAFSNYMKNTPASGSSIMSTKFGEQEGLEEASTILTDKEYYTYAYFPINWDPNK